MIAAKLRKVGGSVMLAIPPRMLDLAHLKADMEVGLELEEGNIVIQSKRCQRKGLAELVAKCDLSQPMGETEWVDAPAMGEELL